MTLHHILVAGGNLAALRTVETLRNEGFDGRITMVSAEDHLPYDRPPLSKQVLTGELDAAATVYRDEGFFRAAGVELLLGTPATGLDLAARVLHAGGRALRFDGLVIATGARPRPVGVADGPAGVHVVRTLDDALALRAELLTGPRVVVVGAGFIGAEVASSARALGLDVTVLESAATPLGRAVGEPLGRLLGDMHAAAGVRLRCGAAVTGLRGTGLRGTGRVAEVLLSDGTSLPADVVVFGTGVVPNTEWLAGSGLDLADGVGCDATLNAGPPAVYAVGDVASWPNALSGRRTRGQQWTTAADQAAHAARNLLAGPAAARPFSSSQYFWSDQYGRRVQFAGSPGGEAVVVEGDPGEFRFVALCRDGDRLAGVLAVNTPRTFQRFKRMVEARAPWASALSPEHV
ncbi:FAD-dependent oxidoreductase [Streptosporangium sp. NPDC051022]|uniref:NAD(P)/FAD-dependent oxidoreductase n=1 Tax=Streptosporangium sp. NPDC051022 TaxID=3155752 RepID=UPI003444F3A4